VPIQNGSWFLDLLDWSVKIWNQMMSTGVGLLTQSPENASPGVWNVITGVNTSMQGIGYGLLVLFFLISLFKQTTNIKDFTLQGVFGYILRFLGGKIAIDYCMTIMSGIISIALDIIGVVESSGSGIMLDGVPQNIKDMANGLNSFDIGAQLPLWIASLIGVIVTCVCGMLFLICVYGRFFRVYIHIALAPLGLSAFGGEATASSGKRFMMSFISVCLEAAVIMLAVVICKGIVSGGGFSLELLGDTGDVTLLTNYIMTNIYAMVLLCTLTFGVNRLTKEMFGGA